MYGVEIFFIIWCVFLFYVFDEVFYIVWEEFGNCVVFGIYDFLLWVKID